MAKGNRVIETPEPRGVFVEGIISGTPKPGTVMMPQAGTAPDSNNNHTWVVYDKAGSSVPAAIAVLVEDAKIGNRMTDAVTSGTIGTLYYPVPGEWLNMLVTDIAGTGATSDFSVGDRMEVIDGLGTLRDASTGTAFLRSAPFEVMENYNDMAGDTHLWVAFTGY